MIFVKIGKIVIDGIHECGIINRFILEKLVIAFLRFVPYTPAEFQLQGIGYLVLEIQGEIRIDILGVLVLFRQFVELPLSICRNAPGNSIGNGNERFSGVRRIDGEIPAFRGDIDISLVRALFGGLCI